MTRTKGPAAIAVFWIVAALVFTAAARGADAPDETLVQNGDAEQGTVGETPPSWSPVGDDGKSETKGGFPFETASKGRDSAKAIMIDKPASFQSVSVRQSVPLELTESAHYRYSVWLRGDRDMPASAGLSINTGVRAGISLTLGWTREGSLDVGKEWTEHTLHFYTPAAFDADGKPERIEAQLCIQLSKLGPLYVDDVSFGRMSISPEEKAQIESLKKILNATGALTAPLPLKGGIISRPDGTLLAFTEDYGVRRSTDGGYTWTGKEKLAISDAYDSLSGAIQMQNGDIGIWSVSWRKPMYFWKSTDGAKTWSQRILMGPMGAPYHGNAMIETQSGRLFIGVREGKNFHEGIYEPAGAYGTINGKRVKVEGHGHDPEFCACFAYYSDDGGATWQRSEFDVWVWKDDGLGGMWLADEPNVAELKDGRLVMFLRTTLGRLYQSWSDDRGRRWGIPEPTLLPTGISPCSLERVPDNDYTLKTGRVGDLLIVWNNVSREEVRKGFRRARLCSAVSRDDGKTWEHVRTLVAIGVPPLDKMAQLDPPGMTRADKELGELPLPFGTAAYPDITFHGDHVLVRYYMSFRKPSMSAG
ncbi:MAG: sialidase family protein, partial [Planctomycetota bacterium]